MLWRESYEPDLRDDPDIGIVASFSGWQSDRVWVVGRGAGDQPAMERWRRLITADLVPEGPCRLIHTDLRAAEDAWPRSLHLKLAQASFEPADFPPRPAALLLDRGRIVFAIVGPATEEAWDTFRARYSALP